MQQPTEENTRRPAEIKLIYSICISLSIYWGITLVYLLFGSFLLYMFQAWADVELIPFYFPYIIFIMLIIVGFSGKINYNFLRLKKWAFSAMFYTTICLYYWVCFCNYFYRTTLYKNCFSCCYWNVIPDFVLPE
jgi:hypothetical protein